MGLKATEQVLALYSSLDFSTTKLYCNRDP